MQPSDAETIEQLQEEVRESSCLLVARSCMQHGNMLLLVEMCVPPS